MDTFDLELVKRLYAPSEPTQIRYLLDVGETLLTSYIDLAKDDSIENIDKALAQVRGAENGLKRLRLEKLEDSPGPHGDGTG
jgi:hypothetical protein